MYDGNSSHKTMRASRLPPSAALSMKKRQVGLMTKLAAKIIPIARMAVSRRCPRQPYRMRQRHSMREEGGPQ